MASHILSRPPFGFSLDHEACTLESLEAWGLIPRAGIRRTAPWRKKDIVFFCLMTPGLISPVGHPGLCPAASPKGGRPGHRHVGPGLAGL